MTLIERLQALTAPDREVDADIYIMFNIPPERLGRIDRLGGCVGWWPNDAPYERAIDVPAYTVSIDALIELIDKALPEWWDWGRDDDDHMCLYPPDVDDCISYPGATPAIALATCIVAAALTAKEAKDE